MSVLAHLAGEHWYEALLYLAPVALVVVALWWSGRRLPDDDDPDDGAAREWRDEHL